MSEDFEECEKKHNMKNNRKKIERFCKKHDIEIISLEYKHRSDAAYGNSWDCPYWELYGWYHDAEICTDSDDLADTVSESVDEMLSDMEEDLNNSERGFFTGRLRNL